MDEPLKLPELPPFHRTQNALRCMACKKPYQPPLTACANSVTLNWSCACGCGTFEGVLGYEPQPRYIVDQLRDFGLACARAALEEAAKVADEYPKRDPGGDGNGYWAAEEIGAAIRNLKVGE